MRRVMQVAGFFLLGFLGALLVIACVIGTIMALVFMGIEMFGEYGPVVTLVTPICIVAGVWMAKR